MSSRTERIVLAAVVLPALLVVGLAAGPIILGAAVRRSLRRALRKRGVL